MLKAFSASGSPPSHQLLLAMGSVWVTSILSEMTRVKQIMLLSKCLQGIERP